MTNNINEDKRSPVPGDMFDIVIPESEIPFTDGEFYYCGHWVVLSVREDGYCLCLPIDIAPVIMVGGDLEIDSPFPALSEEEIPKTIKDLLPGIGRRSEPSPHVIRWTGYVWVYGKILGSMSHLGRLNPSIIAKLLVMGRKGSCPFFTNDVVVGLDLGAAMLACRLDDWEREHITSLGNELKRIEAYQKVYAPPVKSIIPPSQRKLITEMIARGEFSDEEVARLHWEMDIN